MGGPPAATEAPWRRAFQRAMPMRTTKGREGDYHHALGAAAYCDGSAEVPGGGDGYDEDFEEQAAMSGGEGGGGVGEVEDEGGGVDGHVEDAGGEGEPGLLKSPEWAHGLADPVIEAALAGNGGCQLADHEGGGEAPKERDGAKQQKRATVAGHADDVFEAVRASGDHEVGGRDERQQAHPLETTRACWQMLTPLIKVAAGRAAAWLGLQPGSRGIGNRLRQI